MGLYVDHLGNLYRVQGWPEKVGCWPVMWAFMAVHPKTNWRDAGVCYNVAVRDGIVFC